jgi:hypothetical protein
VQFGIATAVGAAGAPVAFITTVSAAWAARAESAMPDAGAQLIVVQTVLVTFGMVTVTAPEDAGKLTVVRLVDTPVMI